MRRLSSVLLSVIGLLTILVLPVSGAGPAAPSVVSYQGQVKVGGVTYDGTGYFKFAIINQAGSTSYWSNDGTLYGAEPVLAVSLAVSNGLFNVLLGDTSLGGGMTSPLTSGAFTAADRYLRVWFSSSGSAGTFILLSPNRRIAAVPYALHVEKEQNLVIVAKSGGDFTTIQAALDSITDASDSNRYLVRVGPGVYAEQVTMKPYVDIEGSGGLVTKITYHYWRTLASANDAEVRFLTVELAATSAADNCAISNGWDSSASPRLTHLTVIARSSAGNSQGVCNSNGSVPVMTDMTITVSTAVPSSYIYGIHNEGSSPVMSRIKVTATSSVASNNYGIYSGGPSSPAMTDVTAIATGGDGSYNYGVANEVMSSPTMANVIATATGGADSYNRGVFNNWAYGHPPVKMTNVVATAAGGTGSASTNYGVDNNAAAADMREVVARASGGSVAIGVRNNCAASTLMTWVTASASGGSASNHGVWNNGFGCETLAALPTLTNVVATASGGLNSQAVVHISQHLPSIINGLIATASGGSTTNWGLFAYGAAQVTVNDSTLSGSGTDGCGVVGDYSDAIKINNSEISGSTNTIKIPHWTTIKVGGSLLDGGPVTPAGAMFICAGVYDEAYTFYPSTCP